jgi:methylmalonyl-CoA/ethylmalonyl-CoA epimerase
MSNELRFHHVGIASRRINDEVASLQTLGYRREGALFTDVGQGIRGQFMVGSGPRLEVLEPHEGSRTLEPWLSKGVKMYHQAFRVDDLDRELSRRKAGGAMVVVPARPAIAFGGRRIAFVMLPGMLLIELIEA